MPPRRPKRPHDDRDVGDREYLLIRKEMSKYGLLAETTLAHMEDLRKLGRMYASGELVLTTRQARYLVDAYYSVQKVRIGILLRLKAAKRHKQEIATNVSKLLYSLLKHQEIAMGKAIAGWGTRQPMSIWARQHMGCGPIIAAGLCAHIDIDHVTPDGRRVTSAGHIWRFAGLDPTVTWEKGKKRPWNAKLKAICWKLGDSFCRLHRRPGCFYGQLYARRKALEITRNMQGENKAEAARALEDRPGMSAAAKAYYKRGLLPPGRLDLRARRYAVKIFLAHWFEEAYRQRWDKEPPLPYPIAHMGHVHRISPPEVA